MRLARKKRWFALAAVLVAVAVSWHPVGRVAWAARLAFSLDRLTHDLSNGVERRDLAVTDAKADRTGDGGRTYEALYYRPSGTAPKTAVIIAAGLSEKGCHDPRLVALARTLASNGLLVVTPDIREFREFEISAEPIRQITFWHGQVPSLEGGAGIRKVGMAGISYSGTMAIIAASRPEIRDDTAFVLAIGPYFDLIGCAREWFAAGSPDEWKGFYPQRYYARWLLMRAALDMLPTPVERRFMDETVAALIATHRAPAVPPGMTPAGRRWHGLATVRPGQTDGELATAIERHLAAALYDDLSPEKPLAELRCPLFLIHGAHDDLIPPRESVELHRRVVGQGRAAHLLVSPLLSHTQPVEAPQTFRQKLATGWDIFSFGYRLAAVMTD
ncbi:MAG: alpha/beta hydrolase [Acidobacteriota bacterium]|jgi:pimeloyl-ACP methyl ester carboxylesterase|nr:alpha/beta hydrolase [Acidobacteriota bacterium]